MRYTTRIENKFVLSSLLQPSIQFQSRLVSQFLCVRMYNEAVINKQLTPSTLETASLDPAAHDDRVPSVLSARVRRPLKNN